MAAETLLRIGRVFLIAFNIAFWITGLGMLGVGIWMKADPYVTNYFTVVSFDPHNAALNAAAAIFITVGLIVIIVGFLGCCGALRESTTMLTAYAALLVLICILQLSAAIVAVVFRDKVRGYLRETMIVNLQEYYEFDNSVGKAWNFVQVRNKCCGADGSIDYKNSRWISKQGNTEPKQYVPPTCCWLVYNQDRDVHRVDPQTAKPQDNKRCQDDAMGNIDSDYIHGQGCFAKLVTWVERNANILFGIGLAVAILQILGIVAAISLSTWIRRSAGSAGSAERN